MHFFRDTLYLDILPNRKCPGPNRNHLSCLVCATGEFQNDMSNFPAFRPSGHRRVVSYLINHEHLNLDLTSVFWLFPPVADSFTLEIIGTTMKNFSMQSTSKYHLDPFGVVSHSEILCFKNPNVHPDFTAVSLSHRFPFLILAIRRDALPQTVKWSF